jgi:hypothetical protein
MLANVAQQYHYALPLIQQALEATQSERIVDLCSGGGGPWFTLARRLDTIRDRPVRILLTDRFPSETAMQLAERHGAERIHYLSAPVDAMQVPAELTGLRTLFTAFHHFPPQSAQRILQDAVDKGQGIGIFEQSRRDPLAMLLMLLLPLVVLLATPFVRPFRWSRLFWTYIIPAIPCVLCFDGMVSCLRTYSRRELEALVARLDAPAYRWQIGHLPSPLSPIGVLYLVGYPVSKSSENDG